MFDPKYHANALQTLPEDTLEIVANALRVRAMDFVSDRLTDDHAGDLAADIVRELSIAPEDEGLFHPDCTGTLYATNLPDGGRGLGIVHGYQRPCPVHE